jgi:hypothetical protein
MVRSTVGDGTEMIVKIPLDGVSADGVGNAVTDSGGA